MRQWRDWRRFLTAAHRASPLAAVAMVVTAIALGLQPAAEFWAVQGLVNALLQRHGAGGAGAWPAVLPWLLGLVGAVVTGEIVRGAQPLISERLRLDTEFALERRLLERAGKSPLLTMETPEFHDRLTRARDGLKRYAREVLVDSAAAIRNLTLLGGVLAVLAAAHPAAVAIILAGVVPGWHMRRWMSANLTRLWREQTEDSRKAQYIAGLLTERRPAQEIRLYDLGAELIRRWERHALAPMASRLAVIKKAGALDGAAGVLGAVSYCGAVALLAVATLAGRLTAGGFAASVRVTQEFQGAMYELIWSFSRLQRTTAFTVDLWALLDDDLPRLAAGEIPPPGATVDGAGDRVKACAVRLDSVTFTYPGATQAALAEVSFNVAPGELVAIVGENGAGKTTLTKLLLGLYRPTGGRISIDGDDPYAAGSRLRARMAPVFQNYLRYAVTAGENIGLGWLPGIANQVRIRAAAAASGADAVIDGLTQGYDTLLGKEWQDGTDLSGGQWQKLAVARAYMRDAGLLILDEPTAALDPLAELEVFRQFRQLIAGRTGVLISHRLGAARLADWIVVLKDGRVVETGTHDELMTRAGEYAALFQAQAEWYR
ncbi:MAG: ATP-binding cassette domain-containing protein [Chloroflexota bacterium]